MLAPIGIVPPSSSTQSQGWLASLLLEFGASGGCTHLRHAHQGPLRIQKALYPDGRHCCHAVIVHPPGGVAAGDQLILSIDVDQSAHALVTTPAANKWYGSFAGHLACQTIDMSVRGRMEWLPAETIVFDGAQVRSLINISAHANASMIGWDQVVFGRHASGERFERGCFDQTLSIRMEDELVWIDRLRLAGSDPLFDSPVGLHGFSALATWWAIAPEHEPWSDDTLALLRKAAPGLAYTKLHPRLLVGRVIGSAIDLTAPLTQAWSVLKQTCWGLKPNPLRLWAT